MSIRTRNEEPKTAEQLSHEQLMMEREADWNSIKDRNDPFLRRQRQIAESAAREAFEASQPAPRKQTPDEEAAISDALRVFPAQRTPEQIKLLESIGIRYQ